MSEIVEDTGPEPQPTQPPQPGGVDVAVDQTDVRVRVGDTARVVCQTRSPGQVSYISFCISLQTLVDIS